MLCVVDVYVLVCECCWMVFGVGCDDQQDLVPPLGPILDHCGLIFVLNVSKTIYLGIEVELLITYDRDTMHMWRLCLLKGMNDTIGMGYGYC